SICQPSKQRSTKRLPHAGSGTNESHRSCCAMPKLSGGTGSDHRNGVARFAALDLDFQGYVTPQGELRMQAPTGQTFVGQIDPSMGQGEPAEREPGSMRNPGGERGQGGKTETKKAPADLSCHYSSGRSHRRDSSNRRLRVRPGALSTASSARYTKYRLLLRI